MRPMPGLSRRRLAGLLPQVLLALLLCLPALVNGFPLVFDDSAHYLRKPFAFVQELARGRLSTDAGQYRGYMPSHFGGGRRAGSDSGRAALGQSLLPAAGAL